MNNTYLKRLTTFLEQARPTSVSTHQVEFKSVFGAVGGYVRGRIFISCGVFGIALKLPPETLASLFKEKDVKHLKYFQHGHVKKEYAVLPKRILQNKREVRKLLTKSLLHS